MISGRNREMSIKKALHRRYLDKVLYVKRIGASYWYDNLHQYSKNKIHCSCPLCSNKTNGKNTWYPNNYSVSDKRKFEALNDSLSDWESEE